MTIDPISVLLVDNEASFRKSLARRLRDSFHYEVVEATIYNEALQIVESNKQTFAVALLGNIFTQSPDSSPQRRGLNLMHAIRRYNPYIEFILFTGSESEKGWQTTKERAFRLLSKAFYDIEEVGHLIRQAKEFGQLKVTVQEKRIMEQLMTAGSTLLQATKLEEVLEAILHAIHKVGFDRVRLYEVSDDRQCLIGKAQIGMSTDFIGASSPIAQYPSTKILFETKQPMIVKRQSQQPLLFDQDRRLNQWGSIPLVVEGQVIGKIDVDNIISQQPISEIELRPLAIFASHAATAIQTTRLRQQEQMRQQKLEVLHQVTETLNSQQNLQEILTSLCKAIYDLFDADHSSFVVFDGNYQMGKVAAEYPLETGIQGRSVQITGIPSEEALVYNHKPIAISNVATNERLGSVQDLLLEFDIQSTMIVPAVFQGKPLGSFSLDTIGRQRQFTPEEIDLCQTIASQAAATINRVQTYEEVQRLSAHSPVGIMTNDNEGKITYYNERAALLLNREADELIGQQIEKVFYHPDEPRNIGARLRSSPNGRLVDHETIARSKYRGPIPVRLSVSWLYDGMGERRGALGHFEDIRYLDLQRRMSNQSMLHQNITDAIQSAETLEEVFHLILTGVTVGFGLGLNRAALFTLDHEQNKLIGKMGLGYFDSSENQKVWDEMSEKNLNTPTALSKQLKELPITPTPLGKRIVGFEIPVEKGKSDVFSEITTTGHWQIIESETGILRLPQTFRQEFEPHFPLLLTPLRSRGKVIGLILADNKFNHHPIGNETVQSMITLANTAVIAISKVQLLEQTRLQAKQLQEASRQAKQLAESEREMLLHDIVERSIKLLSASSGGIYEYDSQQELLTAIADHSEKHPSIVGWTLQLGEGMAGEMVKSRRPYMIENHYTLWEGRAKIFDGRRPFGAVLEVLLKWQNEVVGVLYIEDEVGRMFSADDARFLLMFADHAAIALKNSRLLENEQLAWQQLKDSFEASIALAVAENPRAVLETAIQRAQKVDGVLNAGVVLLDNNNRATALYFSGEDWQSNIENITRNEDSVSVKVKQTGNPYICENIENDPKIHSLMQEAQAKAAICLPFTVRNEHVGVMWVHYEHPRPFKDAEIEALRLYANQAAVAYDRARRIETLQHMRDAAQSLSSTDNVRAVLQQIVASARTVLNAKSATIWAFDNIRNQFIPAESVSLGIAGWEETFRQHDSQPGQTTFVIMEQGYVGVSNVHDYDNYPFLGVNTRQFLEQTGAGSFQGICLQVSEEILGVLYVNYENPREFSHNERQNITTFANHAALALKKVRLLDKIQHAYDTARLIARLSVAQGLDKTLTAVVDGAIEVLGCDEVVLYVYDAESQHFVYPPKMKSVKLPPHVRQFTQISRNSIVYEILSRSEPYLCPDTSNDPRIQDRGFYKGESIKSLVAIPLRVQGEPMGVLFINYRHHHTLSGEIVDTIQLFADQAAGALQGARLYEREKKRVGTLQVLKNAGNAVMSSLDLTEVLDRIAEQVWLLASSQRQDAAFCSILLANNGIGEIVSAYPREKLALIHRKIGKTINWENEAKDKCGITGRAYQTGQNQLVADVRQDPDFIVTHENTRSALAICIKFHSEVIGIILVEHEKTNVFTESHTQILDALAAQAAVAINHAQYVAEIERIKGFVGSHNAVKWMEMVSLTWSHGINRIIGEMKAHIKSTRTGITTKDIQRAQNSIHLLEETLDEIGHMTLTEPLTSDRGIESLKLNKEIKKFFLKHWLRRNYREKDNINLYLSLAPEVDQQTTVRVSPKWLRFLFEILSDNAVQALRKVQDQDLVFTVATVLKEDVVEIHLEDNGFGIPKAIQSQLFLKPIEKQPGEQGAGLGLMQADAIVRTYGGLILYDPDYKEGTRFIIQLPIERER